MTDKVQVEIKAPVATITLNKPERLNALDFEMWERIGEACRAVDAARDVRVAVLMGAGGCFCAGLDVKAGSTLSTLGLDNSPAAALPAIGEHIGHLQECFTAVERLRVPVIPEIQLGIVPDMGGTQRLPRTIGIGLAKELIYSARRVDAAEALRIGLVNHVYPAGDLPARVAELAAEIAANAPLAVQAAKQSINGTYWRDREAWLAWEAAQAAGPLLSDDRNEGMRAAAERKRANFSGS